MKELVLSIILVSSLFFLAQNAFAENLFYGYSSFEKLPSTISATSTFELKIRYTEGPYQITKLMPVFDVSPESAKQYVQIKTNPIEGLHRNDIARIQSTMTIDPQTPHKKIFVSVYFNGTDFSYGDPALDIQNGLEYSTTSIALPTITYSSQKAYVNGGWANWSDFVNGRVGETDPADAYVLECGNDYTSKHGEGSEPASC